MPVASSTAQSSALRPHRSDTAGRLAVHTIWVLRLRWVACAGQLLTVAYAALVFGVKLPVGELLGVILAVGFSNALLFLSWRRLEGSDADASQPSRGNWLLAAVMALDFLALTALLYLTGRPANPFTVF